MEISNNKALQFIARYDTSLRIRKAAHLRLRELGLPRPQEITDEYLKGRIERSNLKFLKLQEIFDKDVRIREYAKKQLRMYGLS